MSVQIREMTIDDYEDVQALWQASEGILLTEADSRASIQKFLARNPDLSLVALDGAQLVGAVLCGQDGRRATLEHLAVRKSHRRQGLGRSLVGRCMYRLMQQGISRCHILIPEGNDEAIAFWKKLGWAPRVEILTMIQSVE